MAELPPPDPASEDRFGMPPTSPSTDELLFRFRRLLGAMVAMALLLAVAPVPSFVHVLALLVLPVFVLVSALSYHNAKRDRFVHRYTRRLGEYRHDSVALAAEGEQAAEPVDAGLRRAWLLLGLAAAVFLIGLVLAGVSAGISEALYG